MEKIVLMSKEDRKFIFTQTAIKLNMNPIIIEKDFWICYVLDYIFNKSKFRNIFTFKGGTSLSKAYNVISRMSEDIDLILDWRILGIKETEPLEDRSKRQQEIYNNKINELANKFIEKEIYEDLTQGFKHIKDLEIERDIKNQLINIYYPQTITFENIGLLPCIRLEIGPLASWTPAVDTEITPYISNIIPGFNVSSTIVRTVSISRTFYEKLTILHREKNRADHKKMPPRYARHYYDVYKIYKSHYFEKIILERELLEKVTNFKIKFYNDNWAKYNDILIDKISLVPNDYRIKEIEQDYKAMKEMLIGDIPSLDEIIKALHELELIINK